MSEERRCAAKDEPSDDVQMSENRVELLEHSAVRSCATSSAPVPRNKAKDAPAMLMTSLTSEFCFFV